MFHIIASQSINLEENICYAKSIYHSKFKMWRLCQHDYKRCRFSRRCIENSVVSFDYENDENLQIIHDKLAHLGYPVENDENSLFQKAKSYASCMIGRVTLE